MRASVSSSKHPIFIKLPTDGTAVGKAGGIDEGTVVDVEVIEDVDPVEGNGNEDIDEDSDGPVECEDVGGCGGFVSTHWLLPHDWPGLQTLHRVPI
jgi:hypothetical protein